MVHVIIQTYQFIRFSSKHLTRPGLFVKASPNREQSRGSSQTAPKTPCTVAPLIFPVRYVYEVSVYLGI